MALRIDRLQSNVPIVDGTGLPLKAYQTWWQRVAEGIESTVNDIVDILVRLGLVEVTADGALELAESAINVGGTIKTEKVLTDSIIPDGVTERYYTQTLLDVTLPDGVETEVMSLNITKVTAESDIDIDVALRLASNDDIRGTYRLYRDGVEIDAFDPFLNGSGGTYRTAMTIPFTESGLAADDYEYSVTFARNGGASTLLAVAKSSTRIKEVKR
jgi:hypothetical protein